MEQPEIRGCFTNKYGKTFSHVEEIAYDSEIHKPYKFGKLVAETNRDDGTLEELFFADLPKVWIYQNRENASIAYRIYQTCLDPGYNGEHDDELIEELMKRQNLVKLTEFPTGVITIDGNIVGQKIPFYPNSITLFELFVGRKIKPKQVIKIYRAIFQILKEMYDAGISYLDNHAKNFMIESDFGKASRVKAIDFMNDYVKFDSDNKNYLTRMMKNFSDMVNCLNRLQSIDYKFLETTDFQDLEEEIADLDKWVKKKIFY